MKNLIILMLSIAFMFSCKSKNAATTETEYKANDRADRSQRGGRKGPMNIDEVFKMDVDGDGFLSKSEVKGRLSDNFDKIDTNGDAKISREELENAPKPERGQRGGQRGDR
ncbi:EF-hand domain-containing protein [Saprospiraceae bacterium]|nr:EF-hand domain-containing protein [Saprospiraceae bacterium]